MKLICPTLLALLGSLAAQSTPSYDFSFADQWAAAAMTKHKLTGLGLAFGKEGRLLYQKFSGSYGDNTVIPLASASKLISACVLMAVIDDGKLTLDDTTGQHLASFTGDKGKITVRQLFSHTSGLDDDRLVIALKNITLAQAVDYVGRNTPLLATPGTEFSYGGTSMHVAGRICEVVTGTDWEQLVRSKLSTPLGITTLDYQGLGATQNYRIAGSAQCRLVEYRRILEMLAAGGVWGGKRVLSAASVQAMFRDQTGGAKIVSSPAPAGTRYGIGCWLDRRGPNGEVLQISSPGAFGYTPWIDLERGVVGVVMVDYVNSLIQNDVWALQASSRAELPFLGAACYGVGTALCGTRMRLLTNEIPAVGSPSFAFTGEGAPPGADGMLLVSAGSSVLGWPLLGVRIHVAPPVPVLLAVRADAAGRLVLPAPIPAGTRGAEVFTQVLWAATPTCGATGATGASSGLAVTVQ